MGFSLQSVYKQSSGIAVVRELFLDLALPRDPIQGFTKGGKQYFILG